MKEFIIGLFLIIILIIGAIYYQEHLNKESIKKSVAIELAEEGWQLKKMNLYKTKTMQGGLFNITRTRKIQVVLKENSFTWETTVPSW